jgi:hypothetical protein
MCTMLSPSSFSFTASHRQRDTSCDTASCCCPEGQWAVRTVSKDGNKCEPGRFTMTENPSPYTTSYGTLTCNTPTVGHYSITLYCGVVLTADVS